MHSCVPEMTILGLPTFININRTGETVRNRAFRAIGHLSFWLSRIICTYATLTNSFLTNPYYEHPPLELRGTKIIYIHYIKCYVVSLV